MIAATVKAAILAVLQGMPSAYVERPGVAPAEYAETPEDRVARLTVVAEAIAEQGPDVAAALLAIGRGESGWARYVLHGCADRPPRAVGDCDRMRRGPRRGEIRARSYWQLWRRTCKPLWRLPVGSRAAVFAAAKCAAARWRMSRRQCRTTAQAFGYYGGRGCSATPAAERKARWYRAATRRLGGP